MLALEEKFLSWKVYFFCVSMFISFVFCSQEAVFYQRPGGFDHSNWLPSRTREVIKCFKKSRSRKTIIPDGHVFGRAIYNVHVLLEHVSLRCLLLCEIFEMIHLSGCVWQSRMRF